MLLDVMNIGRSVDIEKYKPVSSAYVLSGDGLPEQDGLLSYEIFGRVGSKERSTKFGYVDLKRKFIHPFVYNMMCQMLRATPDIVRGRLYATLDPKDNSVKVLKEGDMNGETGIDFFIDNWDKINWNKIDSASRDKKTSIMDSMKPDEIFIDKWLVIPAMYRDVNLHNKDSGRIEYDELNKMYIKLLSTTNAESLTFTSAYNTQATVQETITTIHDFLIDKIGGKNGVVHANIMGKAVDFAAVNVISAPRFVAEDYKSQQVPYNYIGLPLHVVCAIFYPFIVKNIEDRFFDMQNAQEFRIGNKVVEPDEEFTKLFGPDGIKKLVSEFINDKTRSIRTRPFVISSKLQSGKDFYQDLGRPYTITDFLLSVAQDVVMNRYVLSTRFPLTGSESQIINKVKILTTETTVPLKLESRSFIGDGKPEEFPLFPVDSKGNIIDSKIKWIDTTIPNNSVLAGMGVSLHRTYSNVRRTLRELLTIPKNFKDLLGYESINNFEDELWLNPTV